MYHSQLGISKFERRERRCLSNIEKANVATESGLYTMALQIIEFWGRLSLYANRQIWKLGMKVCK